ncbi:MAG: fumarylacetoacetate hydrolase family protein [Chloroflexus sp.]|jgi:2-keto-4-pentenoate hydratase/2-oxohepta-3-ene-1,7-dioic acid hydratase in catechol pathway|uniref:fumarylacetoacetate hydrolase family protein n=1 Tax=unclassified Chloroflexus TaxID=2633855 RepID=UPI0004DF85DB|nr:MULTISPECIES: fumarylacetoacetate hydrolase family protein [unclassified Chloroflexus]MBO9312151.1 fumarylacetoacetate hydrolase family protein [Chloroflexus sp.]MBO9315550.1 fumarylacetoacetate hydrolase family protein [Chloroflexus sp.]MBO9318745.1 fumarylacetoacetate hydrolase family protein [Chloroflexus sp.]MBO9339388.1 fumarylacetoacetate hydrolase family protein [Chloroflexus sp.]MBO9372317.1 fumarylacetoacetate hydrolase family protein [Chloroflexus sp.]
MKFLTYRYDGAERVGALRGDEVIDLSPLAASMLELIDGGPDLLAEARKLVAAAEGGLALAEIELRAPIPRPRKNIICLGMNYAAHAIESLRAKGLPEKLPEYPVFFSKMPTAVNHPNAPVPLMPDVSAQRDWEVELAVIIGRRGRDIPASAALDYVFGYTIMNDVSARDLQTRHQQFFYSKSLDGSAPLGPWIVTADEIPDPHALGIRLRLNGELVQNSTTRDMIFDIPTCIATFSRGITLEPGDIIATGTPAGVGMGMTPQRWLKAGDVMEAEIDGIGVLRNTVE